MDPAVKMALEIAERLTVAKLQSCNSPATINSGKEAANFFSAVYNAVLPIAKQ